MDNAYKDRFKQLALNKLEQLGRLRSEDTLRRPMIAHTIDQLTLDPKSKQDKIKVTNSKNLPKLQFLIFFKIKT